MVSVYIILNASKCCNTNIYHFGRSTAGVYWFWVGIFSSKTKTPTKFLGFNPTLEEDESSILADKRDMFHEACFKCTKCAKPLNSYVILDERKFSFLAPILATCLFLVDRIVFGDLWSWCLTKKSLRLADMVFERDFTNHQQQLQCKM